MIFLLNGGQPQIANLVAPRQYPVVQGCLASEAAEPWTPFHYKNVILPVQEIPLCL